MTSPSGSDRLLLTVREAAELAGISRSHAYQMIGAGLWPVVRLGRSSRVPRRWLEGWIAAQVDAWEARR